MLSRCCCRRLQHISRSEDRVHLRPSTVRRELYITNRKIFLLTVKIQAIFGYTILKAISKLPESGIFRFFGGHFGPKENCTVQRSDPYHIVLETYLLTSILYQRGHRSVSYFEEGYHGQLNLTLSSLRGPWDPIRERRPGDVPSRASVRTDEGYRQAHRPDCICWILRCFLRHSTQEILHCASEVDLPHARCYCKSLDSLFCFG